MSDITRILLIEDHEIVRVGLRELIDEVPGLKVAAEAATLAEALTALRSTTFELVLLDLALGREDGSQLLRELPLLSRPPRVLVLSMHDDAVYAQHLIGLGASGFVRKGVDAEEILRAIQSVMDGQVWMSERANTARPPAEVNSSAPVDRLTPRERQVLELRFGLLDGKDHTLEEVSRYFNVTRERIRQIEAKALRKLRHPTRSRNLRDYLGD